MFNFFVTAALIALLAIRTQPASASPDLNQLMADHPKLARQFVELTSGRTHFERVGVGPTIVLIHGVSGPMQVWDKVVHDLAAAGNQVIRYDLFGRGMSQRIMEGTYDLPMYLAQLEDLLAALEIRRPVTVVGSSFGAVIATAFALQHPDKVRGLALVGPAGFPIETSPWASVGDLPCIGSIVKSVVGMSVVRQQNRKYAFDDAKFESFWPYFDAQLEVAGSFDAIVATMQNSPVVAFLDSYRRLADLGKPVTVVWGRHDVTFKYSHHESLMIALPNAELVTVDNAAHLPQWETPEIVVDSILKIER